jgi:hypothetical protein
VRRAHIVRDGPCDLDLHKLALSNSRAPLAGFPPVLPVAHQFRPERKRSALERLRLMHGAPAVLQKFALSMAGYAEATHSPCAVNVPPFERIGGHIEESSETRDVRLGKIDEPLLLTAFRAAGLTLEAQ